MGPLFNILGAIWAVSTATSKYILLLTLITGIVLYLKKHKKFNPEKTLQNGITTTLVVIGPALVFGMIVSGLLNYFVENVALSTIPLAISVFWSFFNLKKNIKEPKKPKGIYLAIFYTFSAVFLICLLLSFIFNTLLLNSIMALFFYGILFWEL